MNPFRGEFSYEAASPRKSHSGRGRDASIAGSRGAVRPRCFSLARIGMQVGRPCKYAACRRFGQMPEIWRKKRR
jgi:hypothetical protein